MDTCKVKNRGASFVTYRIPEDGVRRAFQPGEVKVIKATELEKLMYQPGGPAILTQFLQVMDDDTVKNLGVHTEPEYYMSEADVVKLVKDGSLDAFMDALDFAPIGVIDLIKKVSVELPLLDLNKRNALEKKTGLNVEAAIKLNAADKEEEKPAATTERRVKTESAPTGRRTEAPKYNIISKSQDAE